MDPRGIEPRTQPCHGRVLPLYYGPLIVFLAKISLKTNYLLNISHHNGAKLRYEILCAPERNLTAAEALPAIVMCPREESNLYLDVRSVLFYPLNYEDLIRSGH